LVPRFVRDFQAAFLFPSLTICESFATQADFAGESGGLENGLRFGDEKVRQAGESATTGEGLRV
jgi:hypothetical protein